MSENDIHIIMRALGNLEGKVDGLHAHIKTVVDKVDKHDSWINQAQGKLVIIASVVGGGAALAFAWIKSHFFDK